MAVAADTATRNAEKWSHPLGWVCVRRLSTGGEVISTILDPTVRQDPQRGRAHEDAAAKTRSLECNRIVRVVEVRRSGADRLVFDTERVPGDPLAAMLSKGALPPTQAASILLQIAYALSVAHEAQLLHGALSTSSVIVEEPTGACAVVRLTDFGIGALCWDGHERDPEVVPISPERVLGLDQSPAEDVYLFGCLAYAMLTGESLFGKGSVEEIRRRHAIEDPPPMSQQGEGGKVPGPIRHLVERCLAKEPEDRFVTGTSLLEALRQAIAKSGIETPFDAIDPSNEHEHVRTASPIVVPSKPNETPAPALRAKRSPETPEADASKPLPPPAPPAKPSAPRVPSVSVPQAQQDASVPDMVAAAVLLPAAEVSTPPIHAPEASRAKPRRAARLVIGACLGTVVLGGGAALLSFVLQPAKIVEAGESSMAEPQREGTHAAEDSSAAIAEEPDDAAVGTGEAELDEVPSADTSEEPETPRNSNEVAERKPSEDRDSSRVVAAESEPAIDDAGINALVREAKQAQAQGNAKKAQALFEEVLRHRPRHREALESLSNIAFNRGDHRSAIGYLNRAVKVSPRDGELRIRLGDAHFKLGEYDKARKHFEQAAKNGHPSAARRLLRVEDAKKSG